MSRTFNPDLCHVLDAPLLLTNHHQKLRRKIRFMRIDIFKYD